MTNQAQNDIVCVRATAKTTICKRFAVKCLAEKVAVAFSRDSGAKVAYGAKMIDGQISSGGSRANWYCQVDEGSVFEFNMSRAVFEKNKNRLKNWAVEIVEPSAEAGMLNSSDLE